MLVGELLLLAVQEAQLAFGAIESALRNHQPSRTSVSKIAQLSKQPMPGDDGTVLQSLLDGLSTEQQACFADHSNLYCLPPFHCVRCAFSSTALPR